MKLARDLFFASALIFAIVGALLGVAAREPQADSGSITAGSSELDTKIVVDPKVPLQTIEGLGFFGGAGLFWEPGPYVDERHIGLVRELGASMARTQIYWDAEPQNDNDDPFVTNSAAFNFGPDSANGRQFPWIRSLKKAGVRRLIASVWTPPIWMKEGARDDLAPFCKGQCGGHLRVEMREEFAEYLLTYAQTLKRETGVDLYALSIQNEPHFENPFEACKYSTPHYVETLKTVRRRFREAGLLTKFFGPEHMGAYEWNSDLGYFQALLDAPPTPLVEAFAVHGYKDGVEPDTGAAPGWRQFRKQTEAAGVSLWMTETSDGNDGDYSGAFDVARGLHLALKEGHVSAWVYFYLADRTFSTKTGRPGPLYDLLRHYFGYVRPGDRQLRSTCRGSEIGCSAFQSRRGVVIVALNTGSSTRKVSVVVPPRDGRSLVLDELRLSGAGALFQEVSPNQEGTVELPPSGIVTWVYR